MSGLQIQNETTDNAELESTVIRRAKSVWQGIGTDILRACVEVNEHGMPVGTISGKDVQHAVIDRLHDDISYGNDHDPKLLAFWEEMSTQEIYRLLDKAFPAKKQFGY